MLILSILSSLILEHLMTTAPRRIAIALSAALIGTTAMAPLASARGFEEHHRAWHGEVRRSHDGGAGAWLGLGIAALAGAAIIANATQPPPPAYIPAPAYPAPPPTCTTINGYAACIGPDGQWQYVR
jgi:hypothetical protein